MEPLIRQVNEIINAADDRIFIFMHPLSKKFDVIVDFSNNEFNIIKSNL